MRKRSIKDPELIVKHANELMTIPSRQPLRLPKKQPKVRTLQKKIAALEKSRDHWKVMYRALKRTGQKTIKQTREGIANLSDVSKRKWFEFWKKEK